MSQTVPLPRRRASAPPASDPQNRDEKVAELRRAWLEGRLDLTVAEDDAGFERLLDDLLKR